MDTDNRFIKLLTISIDEQELLLYVMVRLGINQKHLMFPLTYKYCLFLRTPRK